ncbi:MAG: hypothetical protein LBC98_00555 [Prevotellaceae bacterium]|nr:hypothetical protein [Prevotellaceae bacterium]
MDLTRIINVLLLTLLCVFLHISGIAQTADGKVRQTFSDGSRYEGEWKGGKPHGTGVYYFADGCRYEGEWKSGKFDGEGAFYYTDGSKYVGEWKNDLQNGKGTYFYDNGDAYVGEWKNGKKSGHGVYRWNDGRQHEGKWLNDAPVDAKTVQGKRNVIVLSGAEAVRLNENESRKVREQLDRTFEAFKSNYKEANTAENVNYLTRTEKDVFYYLNLMRANPPLFADTYVKNYVGVPGVIKPYAFDERKQSLMRELKQLKALDLIYPDAEIYEYAECFARKSGELGTVGHERGETGCPEEIYAECCDYGNNDGLLTVLDLLIDAGENNAALGHRKLCLSEYGMAGVSVKPHLAMGYVCVINLGYNPEKVYVLDRYTGHLNLRGEYHGAGTYRYPNGDTYTGEWAEGKKNGKGTYRWAKGMTLEGEWKNDNAIKK